MFRGRLSALVKKMLQLLYLTILNMYRSVAPRPNVDDHYKFKPFVYERVVISNTDIYRKVPHPRSGHRIGADSSNFYSFGGYNPLIRREEYHYEDDSYIDSYPLFQELWKFNYASRRWTKFRNSETLPRELVSNAVILYRNLLMIYGGTGSPFGTRCSNQLYVCNISDEASPMVEVKTTGQLPLPQYGQAIVYHNDYLYAIGGTTGFSYSCDIHRLNLRSFSWEVVYICNGTGEFEPEGRYRHEVGFDGKNIYILAGGTADRVFDLSEIPTFDMEKRQWLRLRTLEAGGYGVPSPRRCHGAVQVESDGDLNVFVTGGQDGENIFNDLWRLNLKTLQWTFFERCELPRPMYFHATAVTPEGRLYVFGGIYSVNDQVHRSNAVYTSWLCIPKLSEMCWQSVLHYSPRILDYSSDDLINAGLPKRFVHRLDRKKVCAY
ncbi:kelch domain-containing protein 10 homolog [Cylas formicarius]|uniref:kelch domain-containing protein 10 homolog n=1 Tax=Cylas formicarius TaxID=197179 RepID=UPI002958C1BE|nr:kelch domain-containing protein 10 homolog [Cylas formicarius]